MPTYVELVKVKCVCCPQASPCPTWWRRFLCHPGWMRQAVSLVPNYVTAYR